MANNKCDCEVNYDWKLKPEFLHSLQVPIVPLIIHGACKQESVSQM